MWTPSLYAFIAFLEFIHTREVEINKMTTQILLNVDVIFTQGPAILFWLLAIRYEKIEKQWRQ